LIALCVFLIKISTYLSKKKKKAFGEFKKKMIEAPAMRLPDFTKVFKVDWWSAMRQALV
jgi:hypothetical protein